MNLAVSGTALLLACLAFIVLDIASFRQNFVRYVSSQARIIETNTVSALLFDDPAAAQRTLSALTSLANIQSAAVYTAEGEPFATFSRKPGLEPAPLESLEAGDAESYAFDRGELGLVRTIRSENEVVGYVYIRASPQTLYDRLRRYVSISAIVFAVSLGVALLVSAIFGRAIANPIHHLAEVASRVSQEKDYSMRAAPTAGGDEVSVLIGAFNEMLEHIQTRDSELQKARDELEARVQERTAALKALSGRLMQLQDEERRHIARELHDSTGQLVTALGMNLAVLQSDVDGLRPNSRKALNESAAIVKDLSRELRTLSHLLHPPQLDIAGLRSALRWYVHGFAERSGIRAELDVPSELGRLPRDVEMAVFRIVQESLTNVHRHSESPTATVGLYRNGRSIRVEVRDQGRGFPSTDESDRNGASLGIGIQGMRERVARLGGKFEIRSDEGGTCVVAIFQS